MVLRLLKKIRFSSKLEKEVEIPLKKYLNTLKEALDDFKNSKEVLVNSYFRCITESNKKEAIHSEITRELAKIENIKTFKDFVNAIQEIIKKVEEVHYENNNFETTLVFKLSPANSRRILIMLIRYVEQKPLSLEFYLVDSKDLYEELAEFKDKSKSSPNFYTILPMPPFAIQIAHELPSKNHEVVEIPLISNFEEKSMFLKKVRELNKDNKETDDLKLLTMSIEGFLDSNEYSIPFFGKMTGESSIKMINAINFIKSIDTFRFNHAFLMILNTLLVDNKKIEGLLIGTVCGNSNEQKRVKELINALNQLNSADVGIRVYTSERDNKYFIMLEGKNLDGTKLNAIFELLHDKVFSNQYYDLNVVFADESTNEKELLKSFVRISWSSKNPLAGVVLTSSTMKVILETKIEGSKIESEGVLAFPPFLKEQGDSFDPKKLEEIMDVCVFFTDSVLEFIKEKLSKKEDIHPLLPVLSLYLLECGGIAIRLKSDINKSYVLALKFESTKEVPTFILEEADESKQN